MHKSGFTFTFRYDAIQHKEHFTYRRVSAMPCNQQMSLPSVTWATTVWCSQSTAVTFILDWSCILQPFLQEWHTEYMSTLFTTFNRFSVKLLVYVGEFTSFKEEIYYQVRQKRYTTHFHLKILYLVISFTELDSPKFTTNSYRLRKKKKSKPFLIFDILNYKMLSIYLF